MIPELDAAKLKARDATEMAALKHAAEEIGFFTVYNTAVSAEQMRSVLEAYRRFFALPRAVKSEVDMSVTDANRGWGGPKSEQVNPQANPDYKEVFDCGFQLPPNDALAGLRLSVYGPNQWPSGAPEFREIIKAYLGQAMDVARDLLSAIACAIGEDEGHFDQAFERPMTLLRGNYYPPRPNWAGDQDFGIAAHTDYGCLTLLALDGTPGLEVLGPDGTWIPVTVQPGTFVINFGEMLQMWTQSRVKATLHRVVGGPEERISVPLFFNPSYDTDVAPKGSHEPILAGPYLLRRYDETYLHLQRGQP
jgi:isopenicillin N synthase-like dioxygenase